MIKRKRVPNARDELDRDRLYVPTQDRSIGRAHAEANDQRGFGFSVVHGKRDMSHELCDRHQPGDTHAIYEQSFDGALAS